MSEPIPAYDIDTIAPNGCLAVPIVDAGRCDFCGHPRHPRTLIRLSRYADEAELMCVVCLNNAQSASNRRWLWEPYPQTED